MYWWGSVLHHCHQVCDNSYLPAPKACRTMDTCSIDLCPRTVWPRPSPSHSREESDRRLSTWFELSSLPSRPSIRRGKREEARKKPTAAPSITGPHCTSSRSSTSPRPTMVEVSNRGTIMSPIRHSRLGKKQEPPSSLSCTTTPATPPMPPTQHRGWSGC